MQRDRVGLSLLLGALVLVDGSSWRVVRERETLEDLVRGETT